MIYAASPIPAKTLKLACKTTVPQKVSPYNSYSYSTSKHSNTNLAKTPFSHNPQSPGPPTHKIMVHGHLKYRHLSRNSAHRQSLLRNLVTSLIEHETIQTTWPKAKEAQRLAEKLISHGKKNTNASRLRAEQILFHPLQNNKIGKVFGELRQRYADRPGGYTRVLRIEPINRNHDQADSAILELVDGPKDMRFAMTARSLVRERAMAAEENEGVGVRDITARNIRKVTRFRVDGESALLREVERLELGGDEEARVMDSKRREAQREREEEVEEYRKKKDTWDARRGTERRGMVEPKEVEDDWDDVDFEARPQKEGWEPYRYLQEQRRSRRKHLEEKAEKSKKKKNAAS